MQHRSAAGDPWLVQKRGPKANHAKSTGLSESFKDDREELELRARDIEEDAEELHLPPPLSGQLQNRVAVPPESARRQGAESVTPESALSGEQRALESATLIDAARQGQTWAFEALVKRYRSRIFALALHLTGSASDADDVTQDAFVRAFRNLDRFEGRSEFFTWLYRIAMNRALNVKRDKKRLKYANTEDPRVSAALSVDAPANQCDSAELRQAYGYLVEAFDKLSAPLKSTVVLTVMQGLSYPEAAVVLETNEGTIAWRIHEARRLIREHLAEATFGRKKRAVPKPPETESGVRSLEVVLGLMAPSV